MIPGERFDPEYGFEGSVASDLTVPKDEDSIKIAVRETKQLRKFRILFTVMLFIISSGAAVGVFALTRIQEKEALRLAFDGSAKKVIDTFHFHVEKKVEALEALSFSMTSYATSTNSTWPYVTLPDFETQAGSIRMLAETVSVVVFPLVTNITRPEWEAYTRKNRDWVSKGIHFEREFTSRKVGENRLLDDIQYNETLAANITVVSNGERVAASDERVYYPLWQSSPVAADLINLDLHSTDIFADDIDLLWEEEKCVVGKSEHGASLDGVLSAFRHSWENSESGLLSDTEGPVNKMYFPVFDVLDPDRRHPVAILTAVLFWESYMLEILPPQHPEVVVVIKNDCDQTLTYQIIGEGVEYVGEGDRHLETYEEYHVQDKIFRFSTLGGALDKFKGVPLHDACNYSMDVYPSNDMAIQYITVKPWIFSSLVLFSCLFITCCIYYYDWRVERNYQSVLKKAKQAGAIVSSMFPAAVVNRLYHQEETRLHESGNGAFKQKVPSAVNAQKIKLKGFLNEPKMSPTLAGSDSASSEDLGEKEGLAGEDEIDVPIADLFPDVTIVFADIVGFTAWSSQREPSEVFMLLQTLYQEFDASAKSLGVFKVETIGDCYVAATGLPEAQDDHAVRMARFAARIMGAMVEMTRELEVTLGPDTGELRIRVGMHSGPVTAGVLRGAKTRFQLFGDTMNMASRMEHNSLPGHIQCSETTANCLRDAGRDHWICPRQDKIQIKGKGEAQTFWVTPNSGSSLVSSDMDNLGLERHPSVDSTLASQLGNAKLVFDLGVPNNRYQRLIDWNVELLGGLLKRIVSKRKASRMKSSGSTPSIQLQGGSTALDEVTEIITLPQYEESAPGKNKVRKKQSAELSLEVITQLRDYVTTIASMYRDNAFHNFEHASHVTMSTNKLLKRVVVRDAIESGDVNPVDLHDYTYGITSDPLTQFTLVFCALVHDVDHAGVSNYQLCKEEATIAKLYKNKSVAEQNSVDLAWDLLMDTNYKDLQKAIYSNEDELKRFRQLMVNIVLATDIFDADMKSIRERRWGRAFQYANEEEEENFENEPKRALQRDYNATVSSIEGANLKATIVMEHLIQASDVAHTMQHWEIYLKWNERLFTEMYLAFENGRAAKDPSLGWYEGEIMFFDKYVVPLAKKLNDCGVFGVSSDEYLNYAKQNRKHWAISGDRIVEEFKCRYHERKDESKKAEHRSSVSNNEMQRSSPHANELQIHQQGQLYDDGGSPIKHVQMTPPAS